MTAEKIKTGVPGLDEMLEGGLIPGRPYIVSGASGTGKTTLSLQFLAEGARNRERILYVALDEPPNEVRKNMEAYGLDLSGIMVFDATPDVMNYEKTPVRDVSTERKPARLADVPDIIRQSPERNPADISINTLQETLKQEMRVGKYTRVVIDSLTSLRYFYVRTSEEDAALQSFLRVLSDLKVTSILTVQLPEIPSPCTETYVARGEIRLHKWFEGRGLVRGVTVEKFRGSPHDHRLRSLRMGSDGLKVVIQHRHSKKAEERRSEHAPRADKSSDGKAPASGDEGAAHGGDGI
jgi:KaiC/GvpD/RAD55 family RecA-like ATPase